MAKPEKDQVLDASASETNPGAGSPNPPSSEPGASAPVAADPHGPAAASGGAPGADAPMGEAVEAEVIEPADIDIDADALAAAAAEALKKAQADAAEWQDKFVRLHAEWDTYRRRTAEQREAEKSRAAEKLVTNLLPVIDDFERTIDYATNNGEASLLGGVEAVHAKLLGVLQKDGVQIIDPKGQAFDALEAQAVATVDDASVPDETVAEVYQKGYRLGAKVLRPAMVTVTTGGPKREKPADPE
ncbi:nucleotide exchange factor GrpE [Gordonibacter pamelaeae]|uniref:nucleotide exchange factor GrpE n=1 Tax=Gordonibacter pamelaeae TaxID=471189 RepID=UPI003A92C4B9